MNSKIFRLYESTFSGFGFVCAAIIIVLCTNDYFTSTNVSTPNEANHGFTAMYLINYAALVHAIYRGIWSFFNMYVLYLIT